MSRKIERQNRVLATSTIETIITYAGRTNLGSGTSSRVELRWEQREDLGSGIFGVVHREECHTGDSVRSRAVKVLRLRQLEDNSVDYKKEIGALIRLSDVSHLGVLST